MAAHQRPEGLRREFAQQTLEAARFAQQTLKAARFAQQAVGAARFAQQAVGAAQGGEWTAAHTSAVSGDGDSCRIGHSSTGSTSAYGMSAAIRWARSRLSQSST